jgi:hypothetical protein
MSALVLQLVSWPALGVALLVFGFGPGAVLRLIVLAFPRNDPRRRELLAEVYNVPRLERPFWVAQQLEVALFEGLAGRIRKVFGRYRIRQRIIDELRAEREDFLNTRASAFDNVISMVLVGFPA